MTTATPYAWLKRIPASLLQHDQIPLIGHPPPFPWKQLATLLAKQLQIKDLSIEPASAFEYRSEKELASGLGDQIFILGIDIAPTGGTLYWVMAAQDVSTLMSLLLNPGTEPLPVLEKDLTEGFYRFIAMETINLLPQLSFDKSVSAHILEKTALPKVPSLCLNVTLGAQGRTFYGTLIISNELQQKWKERYAKQTGEAPLSKEIELLVHVEAGQIGMTLPEWKNVKVGDFLSLDSCSLQPNGMGTVTLAIDNVPIYRGNLLEGNIKIVEALLYHEVGNEMSTEHPNNQEDEEATPLEGDEELEDEEFDEELEEDEDLEDEEEPENEEYLEEFSEIEGVKPVEEEKWPPPPERRPERPSQAIPEAVAAPETQVIPEKAKVERTFTAEELPLPVVVEVGRLQMSVQQLMELQPGNLLNLNIHPENGVDLVVNGKRIAKGELLLIGDILGVRILDIGR